MKFIDFFAGIGGFRLGMEYAGHECVGHCEIDKYANKSYIAIHEPKKEEWFTDDITRVRAVDLPRADCWCFGFPCQDISISGKQGGFTKGKRSSLFFTVTKLIRDLKEEYRPKYLFIENVKNLLSINRGFDFAKLLIELDEVGYDSEWQVLNSKNFGVPQNRERVFIIGHLRNTSTRKVFPITGENGATLKQLVGGPQGYRVYDPKGISCTLASQAGGGGAKTGLYLIGNINPSGRGQGGNVYDSKGVSPTLIPGKGEGFKVLVRAILTPGRLEKRQNGRRIKGNNEPMVTLTTQDRHGVVLQGKSQKRIRRLTPLECFRLQGFTDEQFYKAKAVNSDNQLYRQAGNSVTVNVIYEIAKRF